MKPGRRSSIARCALSAAVLALALAAPRAAAAQYRTETLTLTLDNGRTLPAQLRIPEGAHGRLPVLMLFGGFRNAVTFGIDAAADRSILGPIAIFQGTLTTIRTRS